MCRLLLTDLNLSCRLRLHTQNRRIKMWDSQDVIDYFDSHFTVTLSELSQMSGWSIPDLKSLLMGV